jgi:tRNA A37 N6-isopentenylltransferase MiaA
MTVDVARAFFIVGPTATGKSELAAAVAQQIGAEIVSADAYQIYEGLPLLTAKPDAKTLAKAPHHLVGAISILQEMNAEKFRRLARRAIEEIRSRNRRVIVAGGSGLYIKALTHGLSGDWKKLDPNINGVFVFRDRDELYQRVNQRVETMFENGVIEEVRPVTRMSATASKMIGLREIRDLLEAKMSTSQCIARIQQATRQYAKRQLTWFRHQTNFEPLNLSLLSHGQAVKWISQRAQQASAAMG